MYTFQSCSVILTILCIISSADPHNIFEREREREYDFSSSESGFHPLSPSNASLFYWYLPTLSPLYETAPLMLWLGDGRVSVMKDVFGKYGPFSITIEQDTVNRIEQLVGSYNVHLNEFVIDSSKCQTKLNKREVRQNNLLSHHYHCIWHHHHRHCWTTVRTTTTPTTTTPTTPTTTTPTTTTTTPTTTTPTTTTPTTTTPTTPTPTTTTPPTTTPTTTTPTTTTPTTTTPTTTTPTTTTPTTTTPTTTTPTTTTPTTTTPTTTTPTTTTPTTTTPTTTPQTTTTPLSPPPPSMTTPLPPIITPSRIIRDNTNALLQQLFNNIPISLNPNSLLTSHNILYIDSTAGYATGKPTDNILTAVTSLISSLRTQHSSTYTDITLVTSLHMLETLRANNATQLYHFLSHSVSSFRELQTERGAGRDEDTKCLMSVCSLRQLSSCPRMMSLYYWLNEREGKVRYRLGIRNVPYKSGWIPYNNQVSHYTDQSLREISNFIDQLNLN